MGHEIIPEQKYYQHILKSITEYYDNMFENAPVMMHSINQEGDLVRVNRRWLDTLGYERDEVLGHKSLEFLTDESRARAEADILPLFWGAGSDRSISLDFVLKNGRVLNVLLDAEVNHGTLDGASGLATLRVRDSRRQWQQASTTLKTLKDLHLLRRRFEDLLLTGELEVAGKGLPPSNEVSAHAAGRQLATEALSELNEAYRDTAASLRALVRVHEDWRDSTLELQSDLLMLVRHMDKTLADLSDFLPAER